ncbi:MAG: SPFH domain-containing protein [Abitibacteriaceae bacterium]|nr:SPFH domain-containing protein [Abditibacteriaceae bacterium]MBV9868819.1 SPFH domain-containing protein [Abditibacteriaceae bacterium]
MAGVRNVISTLTAEGQEVMGPDILLWHYPNNDILNGSLLTVESNHFCVLKSRGAILNVYETGQFAVETPQNPIFGSIQQAFYGGQSPWQYEALYVNRAKLVLKTNGMALSREMAELSYVVDYYIHVDTKEDAVLLVQHMPYRGHALTTDDVNNYAGPVIEQAINQIIQVTPLEQVNERIHDITQLVGQHLQEFLATYGIHLNTVKVLVMPRDERMKALISLKAFGLSELDAVRHYVAMILADRGVVSAPNMAIGQPFNIGSAVPTTAVGQFANASAPQAAPRLASDGSHA